SRTWRSGESNPYRNRSTPVPLAGLPGHSGGITSLFQFTRYDVQRPQRCNRIRNIAALHHGTECLEYIETGSPATQPVWAFGSVAHQIKPEFAICRFPVRVDFTDRREYSILDQFEVIHQVFDIGVHTLLGRQADS